MPSDVIVFYSIPHRLRKINWGVYITMVVCQVNKILNIFKWLLWEKIGSDVLPFNIGIFPKGVLMLNGQRFDYKTGLGFNSAKKRVIHDFFCDLF
jgi:hypothetical protein